MCSGSLEETELLLKWRSFHEGFILNQHCSQLLKYLGTWSWKEVIAGTENRMRKEVRKPPGYNQCLGQNGLQSKNREQVIAP